jgi:hypothetical protein
VLNRISFVVWMLAAFTGGVAFGEHAHSPALITTALPPALTSDFGGDLSPPRELTAAERVSGSLSMTLPPMDVELRLATPEQWKLLLGDLAESMSGATYWIGGPFYQPGRPCRVFIPAADAKVFFTPRFGRADWDWAAGSVSGKTLAHELLHCARGGWHPRWDEILDDQERIMKNTARAP